MIRSGSGAFRGPVIYGMTNGIDDVDIRENIITGEEYQHDEDWYKRGAETMYRTARAYAASKFCLIPEGDSADIMFTFRSFVGLHFSFLTVPSCVLEVVIIRRRDKKKFLDLYLILFILFFSGFLVF